MTQWEDRQGRAYAAQRVAGPFLPGHGSHLAGLPQHGTVCGALRSCFDPAEPWARCEQIAAHGPFCGFCDGYDLTLPPPTRGDR